MPGEMGAFSFPPFGGQLLYPQLNLASAIFSAVLRNFSELKNFHLADTFIVTGRLHLASSTRSLGFARSVNLNWEHQRKQTADHEDQKCTGRRYVSEAPE
jgi:hypothetical protein